MQIFRDTWIIFVRQMRPTMRQPVAIFVFGMLQPMLYLVLFAPLLSGLPGAGAGASWQQFIPGLLVMLTLFTTAFAGFGLLPELTSGAHERLLATPMSRVSLLLGRVMRDVVVLLVQAVIIVLLVVPLGFAPSPAGVVAGLALAALLGVGLGTLSYLTAMVLKQSYLFAGALQTVIMPLMLLSGVLLPMELAPPWLYALSRANPVAYVVDAERALFGGELGDVAVLAGWLVALALTAAALFVGARSMRRISA
ncbi:ABC-2 type transport system permease protein [Murinocardiopsis flavida]|uniref:Transport permease protein n=1 Tax=Murinocardiopsis flavida TaxID=645275 RepID=A0A2P8DGW9_9ACTN|nr:ABC transporter permease [Murinocardiopsis flavida]PSK96480.1 ABC-2 type transport system permease protein [Murinocardiopsis flavida]